MTALFPDLPPAHRDYQAIAARAAHEAWLLDRKDARSREAILRALPARYRTLAAILHGMTDRCKEQFIADMVKSGLIVKGPQGVYTR